MPTIKIRNKKTGEIKEIDVREAVNYGMDPSDVLSYLKSQQGVETFGQPEADPVEELKNEKARRELTELKSGNLINPETENFAKGLESGAFGFEQIPQDLRDDVVNYFSSQGKSIPKELSADEKKKQRTGNASLVLIESLEKLYQEAGGGQYSGPIGRLLGKAKSVKGGLGFDAAAKVYENTKIGFAATLKQLTGDVGVLTNKDYERLSKLIPELGSTPEEARKAFNQLRSQMGASFGVESGETAIYDKSQTGALDFLTKPFVTTGKNIAAAGQALTGEAAGIVSPELRGKIYGADILGSQETFRKFEERPAQAFGEQALASGEILLDALGLKGLGKLKGAVKAPNIPHTFSKGALGKARDTAIEMADKGKTTFDLKEVAKVGKEFVTRNPEMKKVSKEILPKLVKRKPVSAKTFVQQLHEWSEGTYTKAGDVRSTQLAKIHDILANAAREQLRHKAPEVARLNQLFYKLYGREQYAKKMAIGAALGFAGGVGYLGASKLLGGNKEF